MIKIHKKDSIIDILIKINHCEDEDVVLEFPFGHPVLHNYTSLKILKNHTKNRDLIIITSDQTAQKLGSKLDIKYSLTKYTDIVKHNYSFGEYARFLLKSYGSEFKNKFIEKTPFYEHSKKYNKSRIGFFLGGLALSIFLFFFVFYFAVNRTFIHITPEISIKNKTVNLYFQEADDEEILLDDENIKLKKVSKLVAIKNTFASSGIKEEDIKKSKGEIEMKNYFFEEIKLLPNTRVITGSGVLFRTDSPITLPPAVKDAQDNILPGIGKVRVTASSYDEEGQIIGSRGNIPMEVQMTLPGLGENRDKIIATSTREFKGGKDSYEYILSEEDIENSKIILEGKIKNLALKELKKQIEIENKDNNIQYEILGVDDIITYTKMKTSGYEDLVVGEQIDSFDVSATIGISTYIYNKELVMTKMRNVVKQGVLGEIENLLYLNEKSLRVAEILYQENKQLLIKASLQIEAFYIHNFLSKTNNYVEKLKNNIAGLPKKQASKILLNNSKISDVQIETRPFFIKNVSKIPQNIEFKIIEN